MADRDRIGSRGAATCPAGIDHLGFQVDETDETCKKLDEVGAKAMMGRLDLSHAPASGSRSYYEIKYPSTYGQTSPD